MHKQWFGICIVAGMLVACSSDDSQQQDIVVPQPAVCDDPIVEIDGADPRFEPPNPTANQDYQHDGKSYKIVQGLSHFSQTGLAAIHDAEPGSNLAVSGEAFGPMQLTAAHPTLSVLSHARMTSPTSGRVIVVHINNCSPYGNDCMISLSRAAADHLNTSNNTKVRVDPIIIVQDGSLSGPGMTCTTVAKQTYALPARPDLGGDGSIGSMPTPPDVGQPQGDTRPTSNSTLKSDDTTGVPVNSSGFLGAPTTLAAGMLESSGPAPAPQSTTTASVTLTAPAAALATVAAPAPALAAIANGRHMIQIGTVSEQSRTQQYQECLNQQFGVPDRVVQNGAVWHTRMGLSAGKAEASILQQRFQTEAQLRSFTTGI